MKLKKIYLSFSVAAVIAICAASLCSAQVAQRRTEYSVGANRTERHTMHFRAGERATIRINGQGNTDLDLFVFDPSDNEVARDISTDDNETVSFTVRTTGNYRIEVRNLGDSENTYTLLRETGEASGGDRGETGGQIGNNRLSRRVEANGTNRHTMQVSNGQRVTVRLDGDGDTDLDIFVFDPSGTEVARDISIDDDESASFTAQRAGTYRVEVRNLGNVWNRYEIWRTTGTVGESGAITGNRLSRRVEANGTNTHTMQVSSGQNVTVRLTGDGDTDVDIFVFDPSGREVARDISIDDNESASFTAQRTGTYRVDVRNLGNVWNGYQIWRELRTGGGRGGGAGGTLGVISYARSNHRVEANSSNRYTIHLRAGEYFALRINGDDDTDLDVFVRDPSGTEVAQDVSLDDDEFVSFTARQAGTYSIEIRNLGNVWNGYQIWRER